MGWGLLGRLKRLQDQILNFLLVYCVHCACEQLAGKPFVLVDNMKSRLVIGA